MSFKQWAAFLMVASSLALTGCQSSPDDESGDGMSDGMSDSSSEMSDGAAASGDSSSYGASGSGADGGSSDSIEQQLLAAVTFYFDFDSSKVRRDSADALRAHAKHLSMNPSASVRLEGHADERGTREYNLALGERRGDSVARFLQSNGASSSQIEVVSYGEEKPANYGSDDRAWAENRRVELVYVSGRP